MRPPCRNSANLSEPCLIFPSESISAAPTCASPPSAPTASFSKKLLSAPKSPSAATTSSAKCATRFSASPHNTAEADSFSAPASACPASSTWKPECCASPPTFPAGKTIPCATKSSAAWARARLPRKRRQRRRARRAVAGRCPRRSATWRWSLSAPASAAASCSNGKIWHGMNGMAGEFGHVTVEPEGVPCGCGNHGCAEQIRFRHRDRAHGPRSHRHRRGAITRQRRSSDAEFGAKSIYNLAIQGDEHARRIFRTFGALSASCSPTSSTF